MKSATWQDHLPIFRHARIESADKSDCSESKENIDHPGNPIKDLSSPSVISSCTASTLMAAIIAVCHLNGK
jgi:hypothetical protein